MKQTQSPEQTLLLDVGQNIAEHEKRLQTPAGEVKRYAIDREIEAAYVELTMASEGTPDYHQALGVFISLLFPKNGPIEA